MQAMLHDGQCNVECNNADCGYDGFLASSDAADCSPTQIAEACTPVMVASRMDYSRPPPRYVPLPSAMGGGGAQRGGGFPARVSLSFDQLRMTVSGYEQMAISTRVHSLTQWRDRRLFDSECQPALHQMLSLAPEEAESVQEKLELRRVVHDVLHLAHPVVLGQAFSWPDKLVTSSFLMNASRPWIGAAAPGQPDLCNDCIEYRETYDIDVLHQFRYFYFPFDRQTIVFDLVIHSADIVGCEQLVNESSIRLPADASWFFDEGVAASVPEGTSTSHCRITISIKRNFLLFFVKNIIVLMIIIQAALVSLWLNPGSPPLLGGRFSVQIFAMVLVCLRMNKVGEDLGDLLGPVSTLQFIDFFYLFQFIIVLLSLCETAAVHQLCRIEKEVLAYRYDHVFRVVMPLVLYPLGTIGMLVWAAFEKPALGVGIGTMGIIMPILCGVRRINYIQKKYEREKARIAVALAHATEDELDDQSDYPLLQEAFALFDLDGSGTMEPNELRSVLAAMYPMMPRKHKKGALALQVRDVDGLVRFNTFDDTILAWREYVQLHDPEGRWGVLAKPQLPQFCSMNSSRNFATISQFLGRNSLELSSNDGIVPGSCTELEPARTSAKAVESLADGSFPVSARPVSACTHSVGAAAQATSHESNAAHVVAFSTVASTEPPLPTVTAECCGTSVKLPWERDAHA